MKTMRDNKVLAFASIAAILPFTACDTQVKQSDESTKPNIIFILADDMGKEWVSGYGADDIQTPNLDKMAETGMKFNNVYSMPQCTPSRVTLLTGQYPYNHGWINHFDVPRWGHGAKFDPAMNPTYAQFLRDAGYKTAAT
ncbi:MAG: sulfatase-like hydrolase/transferase, partial [Bacteroidales bacterium]|nr:sulfatase-like hydrolase/transferase [Bacteroidales bacterium]